ncbi:MAG: phosphoribosyltransferase [Thomasclavelia sp.]|nr:phosphoribosyltransferase [Thomasclavelia sp.]
MHKYHYSRQCLICHKDKETGSSLYHFIYKSPICIDCLNKFEIANYHGHLNGYKLTILYQYNDYFKKLLFNYKGLYDLALKDAFVSQFDFSKYKKHLVVIAPSNEEDNIKRGFNPNLMIVRTFSKKIFTGIYKTSFYKQTSSKNRKDVKDYLAIKKGEDLRGKRLLIFDDVTTSLSTLRAIISLCEKFSPKSIEILVLASHQLDQISKI